jgi:Family of unknown function (DUF5302)
MKVGTVAKDNPAQKTPADPAATARSDEPESGVNEDLKAKMRAALDRKKAGGRQTAEHAEAREKVHGSEVIGGAPKLHRRKAGGGGS